MFYIGLKWNCEQILGYDQTTICTHFGNEICAIRDYITKSLGTNWEESDISIPSMGIDSP